MKRITEPFTCEECDLEKKDGIQLTGVSIRICVKCITKFILHIGDDHLEMIKSMIASRRPRNGGTRGR